MALLEIKTADAAADGERAEKAVSPPDPFAQQVALAAPFFIGFAALLSSLSRWLRPESMQLAAADPLVQLLFPLGGIWSAPLIALVAAIPWIIFVPFKVGELRKAALSTVLGAVTALALAGAIRLLYGPEFPSFIPPEESAAPGLLLGVSAGVIEEAIFRFGVLPLAFLALVRRLPRKAAVVSASLLTGLLFAYAHELGPGAGSFEADYFVTRALVPGLGMSLACFFVNPAFVVAGHCAAHFVINLFFVVS